MARNTRDVALNVEIQTAGEESLRKLGTEVRALAQAGGDAAPQFLALATEIDRLAAQAAALAQFRTAAEGLDDLSVASRQAAAEATRLQAAFDAQKAATDEARASRTQLREELDRTQRALSEERRQLDLLRASYKDGRVAEDDYTAGVAARGEAIANLKKQVADLRADLTKQGAATAEAERDLDRLGKASLAASDSARTLGTSLQQQTASLQAARAAGETLGASFDTAAAAQERLDAALKDATGRLQAATETEAYRRSLEAVQAVQAEFTAGIERQAQAARGKLDPALLDLTQTMARATATLRETVPLEQVREQALREMAAAARALVAEETQLAAARSRAQQEAESELATIRESEEFMRRYTAEKARAKQEALDFVLALEREQAAAAKAGAELDQFAAKARKLEADAQYVRELAAAFDAVEQQAAEAALGVQRLQGYFDKLRAEKDVVAGAFGTAGVRSIQAIELEMFDLQRALITLKGEFADGRISVQDFERATASAGVRMKQLKAEIDTIPGSKSRFEELAEGANNLITKFGALTAALATVGFAVKPVIDAFIALESTQRILTQVTGSTAEAARQIEFIRNVANQAGQKFDDLSQSYAKFAASALQTGVSAEVVERTFKAVALAAGTLGLSSDQAKRALEALSQIASKGVVSMEELRQQLGDALPGVLPLFAKELGISTQQLNKLVESGELLSEEALPALGNALTRFANQNRDVEGLSASWARFVNTVKEAGTTILEGPIGQAAGVVLKGLAATVSELAIRGVQLSESFNIAGRSIGAFAAFVSGDIKTYQAFQDELSAIVKKSNDVVDAFAKRARGTANATAEMGAAADAAAPAIERQAAATQQAGQAAAAASSSTQQQAAATQQAGQAAAAATAPQQALAAATSQVASAAGTATSQLVRLKAEYVEVRKATEDAAQIAAKNVETKKAEAEAIRSAAQLSGDEARIKRAAAEATAEVAQAERESADAKKTVVDVLRAQRAATEAQAKAEGKRGEDIDKMLKQLDERIAKEQAAATQADRSALAAETQAAAARVAVEAIRDNSDRLGELAIAYAEARERVETMRRAQSEGLVTQDAVNQAVLQAAAAQRLYSDALTDTVAKSKFAIDARKALAAVEAEGLKVQTAESQARQRAAQANLEYAKSKGDMVEVARLERAVGEETIKQKQVEAAALRNEASLVRDNAQARIDLIDQQRIELQSLGTLTPEKDRELQLERFTQQALLKTAEARLAQVKGIEAETAALKRLQYEKTVAAGGYNPGAAGGLGGFGSTSAVAKRNEQVKGTIESGFGKVTEVSTGQMQPPTDDGMWEVSSTSRNAVTGQANLSAGNGYFWTRTPAGLAKDMAAGNQRVAGNNAVLDAAYQNAGIGVGAAGRPLFGSAMPAAVRDQVAWDRGQVTTAPASQTVRHEIALSLGSTGATVTVGSAAEAESLKSFFDQLDEALRRAGGGGP